MMVCFALAGVWVKYGIDGYVVTSTLDHYAASNPSLCGLESAG